MHADTAAYNASLSLSDREICEVLAGEIDKALPQAENKIWHAHPVWFLEGNPIVGYSKLKSCVRLLFWSGQSFDEKGRKIQGCRSPLHGGGTGGPGEPARVAEKIDRHPVGLQEHRPKQGQAGPAQVVPANGALWALKDRFSIISLVHHGHHFFLFFPLVHPFQEKSP